MPIRKQIEPQLLWLNQEPIILWLPATFFIPYMHIPMHALTAYSKAGNFQGTKFVKFSDFNLSLKITTSKFGFNIIIIGKRACTLNLLTKGGNQIIGK